MTDDTSNAYSVAGAAATTHGQDVGDATVSTPLAASGYSLAAQSDVLERMAAGYIRLDRSCNIVAMNSAAERMDGRARAELLGRSHWSVWPTSAGSDVELRYSRARDTGNPEHFEYHYEPAGRTDSWFEISVYPFGAGWLDVSYRDITARKRAESRLHALVEASVALAQVVTPSDAVEAAVAQAVRSLCADSGVVVLLSPDGATLRVAAHLDCSPQLVDLWQSFPLDSPVPLAEAARTGSPVALRDLAERSERYPALRVRSSNAEADQYQGIIAMPLIADGESLGAIGVTFRRPRLASESELGLLEAIARQAAVAVRRATLFERLDEARQSADAANRSKSDFLRTMSHELRTPLSAILGFSGLLRDGITGPVTSRQVEQLGRIEASARHLLALIEDVLNFARLEGHRERPMVEQVDVAAIVRDCAALIEPMATTHGLAVTVTAPVSLISHTDPRRLRQILLNLLGNSVRFTDHGSISLDVSDQGDMIVVTVTDTGVGIAQEHLERIFEPFWQVDQKFTRNAGGTGLGLGVSRQLAQLLGGELHAVSQVGQGTTMQVFISRDMRGDKPQHN